MKKFKVGVSLNYAVVALIGFITLYPFIYILSMSITPATALARNKVMLLPLGFNLSAYRLVFTSKNLMDGFVNTVQYTLVGTIVSVFLTTFTAYPLAQPHFKKYANIYMTFVLITMMFGGGLIPTYLTIRNLGLVNSFWVMIIPGAISPFYLILVRTFIRELPSEMYEAAHIEGASDFQIFMRIIVPLSQPIIACISLYYAVGIWNNYMTPLIYLTNNAKMPLQVYLRQIVLLSQMYEQMIQGQGWTDSLSNIQFNTEAMKCATLVVSAVPLLVVYPFLQKYFVRGIMIGAIKG